MMKACIITNKNKEEKVQEKIIEKESSVPIFVLRDYDIPNWVDKKTFIIASSYSGNTEETLSSYSRCLDRGCLLYTSPSPRD